MNRMVYRWMCAGFLIGSLVGIGLTLLFPSRLMLCGVLVTLFAAAEMGWRGR